MAEEKKLDPQVLKERVGKHLRTADEFTRHQRYEEALLEIEAALELDAKNNYARSFYERVKLMHKRMQKDNAPAAPVEMSLEDRMALISQHLSTAEEYINKRDYKHALEEVAKVYKIDPKNYYAQTYSQRIDTLMLEENKGGIESSQFTFEQIPQEVLLSDLSDQKQPEAPKPQPPVQVPPEIQKPQQPEQIQPAARRPQPAGQTQPEVQLPIPAQQSQPEAPKPQILERGSIAMYRELLKDVWLDGKVTEQEAQELATMRELFGITQENHIQLEREIKIEAYLEALRIAWRDNTLSEMEQKTLQMMREKYGISPEEQSIAEKRYDEVKRSIKSRSTILIVDTDRTVLVSLSKLFKLHGFTVLMAQKVEDALQILNNQMPNIILTEVLFPNSQIDGVGFLQRVREHSVLKKTPVFFMSSIDDKKVLLASYRLGIDQFLIKPVDTEVLIAMIEGKLKAAV
jgi:CheY-like chemotaxis protein